MRRLLLIVPLLFLGCGAPYMQSVFDQAVTSRHFNETANQMGAAMRQGKTLDQAAEKEIRAALDDMIVAHSVTLFALESYKMAPWSGTAQLETERKNLLQKTERAASVIKKHLNKRPITLDGDSHAAIELLLELPPDKRRAIIDFMREVDDAGD